MSLSALFEILFMSAVICKQRFLYENETVQYLQNYIYIKTLIIAILKSRNKILQTSWKTTTLTKVVHTFLMSRSIFSYFLRLNCYNFHTAWAKPIEQRFLETAF